MLRSTQVVQVLAGPSRASSGPAPARRRGPHGSSGGRRGSRATSTLLAACLGLTLLSAGCRESGAADSGPNVTFPASTAGAAGCSGLNQTFVSPLTEIPNGMILGAESQICAARGGELLYATGAAARVYEIVPDPVGATAATTLIIAPTEVAAFYLAIGITDTPLLSGICVLDADTLAVMEHTANVVLLVARDGSGVLGIFAGSANTTPGFADGFPGRFSFAEPGQLVATGNDPPELIIADTGNDRLRLATGGALQTLSGTGQNTSVDGDLEDASFNLPNGLTIACDNRILVTEGNGERLREIVITGADSFGLMGMVMTLAGGGLDSEGAGADVRLTSPKAPFITAAGDTYWVDAGSAAPLVEPTLRRQNAAGNVDCPLWVDCDTVPVGWPLTPGGTFSLAMTDSGALYLLDADSGTLYVIAPP